MLRDLTQYRVTVTTDPHLCVQGHMHAAVSRICDSQRTTLAIVPQAPITLVLFVWLCFFFVVVVLLWVRGVGFVVGVVCFAFLGQVLSLAWNLQNRLSQLANKSLVSSCLHFPRTGNKNTPHHIHLALFGHLQVFEVKSNYVTLASLELI